MSGYTRELTLCGPARPPPSATPRTDSSLTLRTVLLAGRGQVAFVTGLVVYLADRVPGTLAFHPYAWSRATIEASFGAVADYLPTLLHTYAFILVSAVMLVPWLQGMILLSLSWVGLEMSSSFLSRQGSARISPSF